MEPSYMFKGIKKFNKGLTAKQLMQADLLENIGNTDFQDKVAKCFEFRCARMQKRQQSENKKWTKVLNSEKNYILYKRGYKHMLGDLEKAKRNISKFKRGLSIFEDTKLREQLLSNTNAPVISVNHLRSNLQNVVLAHQQNGPQTSIVQHASWMDNSFQQNNNTIESVNQPDGGNYGLSLPISPTGMPLVDPRHHLEMKSRPTSQDATSGGFAHPFGIPGVDGRKQRSEVPDRGSGSKFQQSNLQSPLASLGSPKGQQFDMNQNILIQNQTTNRRQPSLRNMLAGKTGEVNL